MGFLEEYYNPTETATMEYRHISRFLRYIFPTGNEKRKMEFELSIALDSEMQMIKDGTVSIPKFPEEFRDFENYSLEVKSTLLLCTRITNISKALSVLEKYDRRKSADMIEKLKYVWDVLQEEYRELHGEYYNPKLSDKKIYRNVHGCELCFAEYLMHRDLYSYFSGNSISDYDFYMANRKSLYQYMSTVYIRIELEMMESDIAQYIENQRDSMDFVQYYSLSHAAGREMERLRAEFDAYAKKFDMGKISGKMIQHKMFMLHYRNEVEK